MFQSWRQVLWSFLLLVSVVQAQFNFFEQMFGGGEQQQRQQQRSQNAPSDSDRYQQMWSGTQCDHYICPGTLACVHFPHHCPCPHPDVEEKVEFGEGSSVCVSKGGFKEGEAARKIELARKGLL
ncbi:hypothetical protein N7457_001298 [Penicillium paradoxum]|uniref:uncharacterized protein n=1 Tax=Penicillium paradoxum TaxID=176176 RepID=UPI00254882F9|nr:uncharacterized protein N7457_001298 [Penicillium paradoxum]KAJ5794699.1 hypothetical protein N7457_001298 [Penicillium paradoxum]